MTVVYSIFSWLQQAMSFLSVALNPPPPRAARPKSLHGKCHFKLVSLSLACGSGLRGPIIKEPPCGTLTNRLNQL